jgi:hypothetical protein
MEQFAHFGGNPVAGTDQHLNDFMWDRNGHGMGYNNYTVCRSGYLGNKNGRSMKRGVEHYREVRERRASKEGFPVLCCRRSAHGGIYKLP